MRRATATLLLAMPLVMWASEARGTAWYYEDVTACSPSGQYRVDAQSPDNKPGSTEKSSQADFVYTCRDTRAGKTLWTRKQRMGKPIFDRSYPSMTFTCPEEGSPVMIFVSDSGWTAVRTGWNDLIVVTPGGRDRCRIDLVSDALTREEREKYVVQSTGGPLWSGYAVWYFLDVGGDRLFVIRPWWGRRILIDIENGTLAQEAGARSKAMSTYERSYVLTELANGTKTQKQWERGGHWELVRPVLNAAFLAGRLEIADTIPLLRQLEDSPYVGISRIGHFTAPDKRDAQLDPDSYSTLEVRQVVQLSLRRLGEQPKPLPANEFCIRYSDYRKDRPYVPKGLTVPRHANTGRLTPGMSAEQVLDLVGAPDFVGRDTWEYDMDANPPFSLVLKWGTREVKGIEKKSPPLWQQGFVRDEQVASWKGR